ncbi:DUF2946 family protein [Bacillus sp. NP157]|nr:DUF2946 family protein [Bacillus sp. NP157]
MALVAVWLAVLAPTVSRVTAFAFPDLGAWCAPAEGHPHGTAMQGDDDACGYCTLYAQLPGLAASFHVGHVPWPGDALASRPAGDRTFVPGTTIHVHPRGPPVLADA